MASPPGVPVLFEAPRPGGSGACNDLPRVFNTLAGHYGAQDWWPAKTRFEVLVGAILTQNTAWRNVEKAIDNLRRAGCLSAHAIERVELGALRALIRPSGCFNQKATRLKRFCAWYIERGELAGLSKRSSAKLRSALLEVSGIGPETADAMLLYAFDRAVFIADAYASRILSRLGLCAAGLRYDELNRAVTNGFHGSVGVWQEFHALLVAHAKHACKKRPDCAKCCLRHGCAASGFIRGP